MSKLYLVHGNTWYEGYGEYQNLYGVFTDRKTAEKVKTEITKGLHIGILWETFQIFAKFTRCIMRE